MTAYPSGYSNAPRFPSQRSGIEYPDPQQSTRSYRVPVSCEPEAEEVESSSTRKKRRFMEKSDKRQDDKFDDFAVPMLPSYNKVKRKFEDKVRDFKLTSFTSLSDINKTPGIINIRQYILAERGT